MQSINSLAAGMDNMNQEIGHLRRLRTKADDKFIIPRNMVNIILVRDPKFDLTLLGRPAADIEIPETHVRDASVDALCPWYVNSGATLVV